MKYSLFLNFCFGVVLFSSFLAASEQPVPEHSIDPSVECTPTNYQSVSNSACSSKYSLPSPAVTPASPAYSLQPIASIRTTDRIVKSVPWSSPPHWSSLQRYADTITAFELEDLLQNVYVPDGSWKSWITITPRLALIEPYPGAPTEKKISLSLAPSPSTCQPLPRYWKVPSEINPSSTKPLAGLHVVIDPGHLGGSWSKMEERWFRMDHSRPVEEGTMTLIVAKLLKQRLQALGAEVQLTRNHAGPTTPLRPHKLRKTAIAQLKEEQGAWTAQQLKKREEILFYRTAEIHHRADLINNTFHPDLVICLHFNAEEWGDEHHPTLTDKNHLHFLISGDFSAGELQNEEDRYVMLRKLLGRVHSEEVGIADAVAQVFVGATALPPFIYHNPAQAREALPSNSYICNRNLLATRLIEAPTLYCEPYVMNSKQVFQRVQAGDYRGYRLIGCEKLPSIYREYADAVAKGIMNYLANSPNRGYRL